MDDKFVNDQSIPQSSETIPCPGCQQPLDVHDYDQAIQCPLCDYEFVLLNHTCPNCFNYHEEETAVCQECGESINRICRQCHTANWGGADICGNCGSSLDIFESMAVTTQKRLAQQMNEAAAFKKTEAEASRIRMEELEAIERERRTEIYHHRQKRQQEERIMLFLTVGILLAVSLIAIFYFWLF